MTGKLPKRWADKNGARVSPARDAAEAISARAIRDMGFDGPAFRALVDRARMPQGMANLVAGHRRTVAQEEVWVAEDEGAAP